MVRRLEEKDVSKILIIQNEALGRCVKEDFVKSENYIHFVAESEGEVVGFLTLLVVDDLSEVVEVAVKKEFRGKGFAKALLKEAERYSISVGKKGIHLEVRESNTRAREVYKAFGFEEIFVRKKYYDGKENAIIMQIKF